MNIITNFSVISTDGVNRINYTYDVVNDHGDLVSVNKKGYFVVTEYGVNEDIQRIINAIKNRL